MELSPQFIPEQKKEGSAKQRLLNLYREMLAKAPEMKTSGNFGNNLAVLVEDLLRSYKITQDDVKEILGTMRECLESPELKNSKDPEDHKFLATVQREYNALMTRNEDRSGTVYFSGVN